MLALLQGVVARQEKLEAALEARAPAFRPSDGAPKPRTRGPFGGINEAIGGSGRRGWREAWATGVSNSILIDVHGEKVPEMLLTQLAPRFAEGSEVRINPEAVRPGFPAGQTWGDVLRRVGSSGVGRVHRIFWLTDEQSWKYACVVPGVTGARPDGFHDHELLAS